MKKSNSKQKAQSAFKKLGAVALITATIFFVACKQAGNTGGESTPKHAINFSVDSTTPNGMLKAEGDGITQPAVSPITVEEGKTVTFTATANAGYKVGKWKVTPAEALQANTGADGSETAKVKITADTTVSVSFIKKTYAINFSVDSTTPNGTLKVEGDGITQPATSPITVEEGKTVTFTATANDGYRVKGWTLDGSAVNGTAETYTLTVTQAATVSVSFEPNPVEGGAVLILSPNKLNIKVKAKTEDGSAITVEGCNETTLASDTKTTLHARGTTVILKGNITELDVSGTSENKQTLTALNVQGLTSLQTLKCYENQLTELNVQGLTSLQMLNCYGNQLTELNVQGLTSLQVLDCSSNKLPELNVQGLTSLQTLWCPVNQLTALNVQGLPALKLLGCYGNQIKAQAMTELLNALPAREEGDNARAVLYTERTNITEGNCKDFTQPAELKAAFDGAKKKRNWKLWKRNVSGSDVKID